MNKSSHSSVRYRAIWKDFVCGDRIKRLGVSREVRKRRRKGPEEGKEAGSYDESRLLQGVESIGVAEAGYVNGWCCFELNRDSILPDRDYSVQSLCKGQAKNQKSKSGNPNNFELTVRQATAAKKKERRAPMHRKERRLLLYNHRSETGGVFWQKEVLKSNAAASPD